MTHKESKSSEGSARKDPETPDASRPARTWLSAWGVPPADASRPLIGVVACAADVAGTSPSLQGLLQSIERGVQSAGGIALRLPLAGIIEEPSPVKDGRSYLFARRSLLADEVECLARSQGLDGLVLVADQNDAVAGLMLGAARVALPTVFVPARGSLESQEKSPAASLPDEVAAARELMEAKKKSSRDNGLSANGYSVWRDDYAQGAFRCLAEIMGLAFPLSSTVPTGSPEQMRLATTAGQRVVSLVQQNFDLRRVLMPNAFANAIRLDAALGGWPGSVVFLLSLAQEMGVKMSLDSFVDIGQKTPQLAFLPGGDGHGLRHLHEAGGLPALMRALKGQWLPHLTVSGRGINDLAKAAPAKDSSVIRIKSPYRKEGGLMVLKGNLALKGAIFQRSSALPKKLTAFAGPAKVFDSRDAALEALLQKKVQKGDVLVVRYEGPKAGTGFRPLALISHLLAAQKLSDSVALVTDGRLGGAVNMGLCVEMAAPEAAEGSTLSVLRDGDRLEIDLTAGRIMAYLTDTDLKVRLARWQAPVARSRNGFLSRFARSVAGALDGAVLK
jgi:dihydroxy-acid dehydratase